MQDEELDELDYTNAAWESLYDVVDNSHFDDQDAQLIYNSLRNRLRIRSFGDYLRRYIYVKAGFSQPFDEVPLKDYQDVIRDSFADNETPRSFAPTTAKLSALSKNWLTQQTVKRRVVFLLGFGLNMSVEDVNQFLTKALREPEINAKDPFEVTCWYCYKNRFNYLKFEQLWEIYQQTPPNSVDIDLLLSERTVLVRNDMQSIQNDAALISHLSRLKTADSRSKISVTSRACFDELYDQTRCIIADLYNRDEEESHGRAVREYISSISRNDRLYDCDKADRIEQFRSKKRLFTKDDITESDIEHVICAAIPTDRHGNLSPAKASELNGQFSGKRFSRQRISEILSGDSDVSRFDLITLNFFLYSQRTDEIPDSLKRFTMFQNSTNGILEKCFMGRLYVQNPYECFVLMCILSDDPLGTYADVWELSYRK